MSAPPAASPERATTMKVRQHNRDALARIAASLGSGSLDEALAEVLFAYQSLSAVEALTAAQLVDWQAEAQQWAETGLEVPQE
jgi:hypothetical protein